MDEMPCIAYELEKVVHSYHTYTPPEEETEVYCKGLGLYDLHLSGSTVEQTQLSVIYRLAMKITVDGVQILHRSEECTEDLDELLTWQAQYDKEFKPGLWFPIKQVSTTQIYRI